MKKKMGRKSKVLVAVLLAGVLCAGTVVAQAGGIFELEAWDSDLYGSEVTFSLPSGAQRAIKISADHNAEYGGQNWVCKTEEYFDR